VTTTGGALPEVVGRDGETAVLVPPDDPGALAAALGALLDDPVARARLGAAGRDRVLRRFTWRVTAEGTAECYSALLEEHGPKGPGRAGEGERARGASPAAGRSPLTGAAAC